jgi:3-oxoacyl-[acyl-carrier protein] reductase
MDLRGRNALVTGVSRRAGIGYAIARRLMDAGAAVFVQGWTEHDAAQPWGSEPGGTETVAGELDAPFAEVDFADPAAPEQLVAAATEALGPLDILVVNHARSGDGRLADLSAGSMPFSPRTSALRCCWCSSSLPVTTTLVREGASC